MAAKKTDLANTEEDANALAVAQALDSLFEEASGEGFENTTSDDIQLPRLVILQPTSPEVQEDAETYHGGDIINSVTKENYGKEFVYYPIFFYKTRTQWESPEIGSPIICRSSDGLTGSQRDVEHGGGVCLNCPQSKFTERFDSNGNRIGESPRCTEFRNLVIIDASGSGATMAYSAKKTAHAPFKVMLSQATQLKRKNISVPLYFGKWKITSEKKTENKQTWYVPKFELMGFVDSVEVATMLKTMHLGMKENQSKLRVHEEPETYDATPRTVNDEEEDDTIPF